MKNFICGFLSLSALLLTSCSTHTIENIKDNGGQTPLCTIKNVSMTQSDNVLEPKLNIKKMNENFLGVWVKFHIKHALNVPLKNPQIILKLYSNKKVKEEIRLAGMGHRSNEAAWETYREKNNLPIDTPSEDNFTGVLQKDVYPSEDRYSGIEYWGAVQAVSFKLSLEHFSKILNAEELSILIQTEVDPLTVNLDRDQIKTLLEFKRMCLSN